MVVVEGKGIWRKRDKKEDKKRKGKWNDDEYYDQIVFIAYSSKRRERVRKEGKRKRGREI